MSSFGSLINPKDGPKWLFLQVHDRRLRSTDYTMHHGQRLASGYGTYLPILFENSYPELDEIASNRAIHTLATWGGEGIDLILIDEADMPSDDRRWETIDSQSRLDLLTVQNGVRVYRVE